VLDFKQFLAFFFLQFLVFDKFQKIFFRVGTGFWFIQFFVLLVFIWLFRGFLELFVFWFDLDFESVVFEFVPDVVLPGNGCLG
jgi:hypothetical protein